MLLLFCIILTWFHLYSCLQKESLSERVRSQDNRLQDLEKQVEEASSLWALWCVGGYPIGM